MSKFRIPQFVSFASLLSQPLYCQTANPSLAPAENLEEMVITGTRTERTIDETPVRTELVQAREIQMTNAQKVADVIEYQTGLRVESNCSNCNTSEIRMLGLQQRYLALLNDGNVTFSGLAGVYGIEQIPTGILDRIEVVKGGASSLYGSNAVAGVVNLIPKDPAANSFTFDASANIMSGDRSSDRINTDTNLIAEMLNPSGTFGIIAYGMQSYVEGVDLNHDNFTEISRRDLYGAGLRAVWQPNNDFKLAFDYLHTDENRRGGEDGFALDLPANHTLLAEELTSLRDVGTITLTHRISPKLDYRAALSLANTARDSYYGGIAALGYAPPATAGHNANVISRIAARFPQYAALLADPAGVFYNPAWTPELGYGVTDNLLVNTDISFNYAIKDGHILTIGHQYRYETIEDGGLGRFVDDEYKNNGFFVQHDWMINDQVELVYGLRADQHSKVDDLIFSPRATVKYSPSDRFDIRTSIATGFRAPELFDEDLHISNVGGELQVVELDPNLEEEKSISYSISPNWRINDTWELEGSLFATKINDVFFNDISNDDPATAGIVETTKINSGSALVHGIEMNLIRRQGHFTYELGLVEQRSRFDSDQLLLGEMGNATDNPILLRDFARTPNRYGVLKLAYDDGSLAAFVAGKLTGPMDVPHVVTDDGTGDLIENRLVRSDYFFAVDVGASYAWNLPGDKKITLQAGIKNVFDAFQDDLDRGAFRDPAFTYGPRFPRTCYVGAKVEF